MEGLKGSTYENPWLLDSCSGLVLAARSKPGAKLHKKGAEKPKSPAAQRKLVIFKGPPSTIPRSLAGPVRTTTTIRSVPEQRPKSLELTPPRPQKRPKSLTVGDLYRDEIRPPPLNAPKPHHVCGLCHRVKSHPVSYECGHSHCFVCVRLWFVKKQSCPECSRFVFSAPYRHYGEERSLETDYPDWRDNSRVSYSWQGVVFPRRPSSIMFFDSP
ncbi:hypothetical protein B0H11DRAFT_2266321 [Mycena galericulata]|nr:hypothetical protein B0H11DRAFT_2266321 [Mycena galericulata]